MTWTWNFTVMVILITSFSFAMIFMFGTRPLAMAMVWVITRVNRPFAPRACPIYDLEPTGPWPGVCEKACSNPWMVNSCYQMSGVIPHEPTD